MLPMLQPFILVVLLFRVVDVVKLFDVDLYHHARRADVHDDHDPGPGLSGSFQILYSGICDRQSTDAVDYQLRAELLAGWPLAQINRIDVTGDR